MTRPPPVRSRTTSTDLTRKADLSPPRQRLVELMQEINFGRVEDLVKRKDEPQWSPPPRVFRDVIIGKPPCPHPEWQRADFALKDHVTDFFEHFDRASEGARFTIFVRDGLPVRFTMEEPNQS